MLSQVGKMTLAFFLPTSKISSGTCLCQQLLENLLEN